jgi:WD40 repeat protein
VNTNDGTVLWSEGGDEGKFVRGLAWSGDLLVSGGDDATVVVRNAADGTIRHRFTGLASRVSSVAVSGQYVAASTGVGDFELYDSKLKFDSWSDFQAERSLVYVWDVPAGRQRWILKGHRESVNAVGFINRGTQILSCSGGVLHGSEHSAFVWDVQSGSLITNLGKRAAAVVGCCADADGQTFCTVCWDGSVQSWAGRRVTDTRPIVSHDQEIRIIEFSPDGCHVVTTSWDDPPRIWDVTSGRHVATLTGHEALVRTVWFSSDGRFVLTGSGRKYPKEPTDYTARLWDVASGQCRGILEPHEFPVTLAKFSMDGRYIVTGESDVRSMVHRPHNIRVWDARSLRQIAKIGHGQPEFMISLVSGDDPERLMLELERMGVVLAPSQESHLFVDADRSLESRVRAFKSTIRRREKPTDNGLTLGWVPELPSNAITPYALHPASMTFAIACGSDLRLYRLERA